MTKKHFIALAEAMRNQRPRCIVHPTIQWESDVRAICRVCEQFNARFDRSKFLAYVYENKGDN